MGHFIAPASDLVLLINQPLNKNAILQKTPKFIIIPNGHIPKSFCSRFVLQFPDPPTVYRSSFSLLPQSNIHSILKELSLTSDRKLDNVKSRNKEYLSKHKLQLLFCLYTVCINPGIVFSLFDFM